MHLNEILIKFKLILNLLDTYQEENRTVSLCEQLILLQGLFQILKFKILNAKNDPSLRMYENIRVPPPEAIHKLLQGLQTLTPVD